VAPVADRRTWAASLVPTPPIPRSGAQVIQDHKPIPDTDTVRRLLRVSVTVLEHPTVQQWLTAWLPTKKNLSRNAHRSYESHIRLYLIHYLGTVRIDKLRVAHVADMFEQIAEHNEEITATRASNDDTRSAAVKWQRPVGPSSMQRIRETLRTALNDTIRQEFLLVNVPSPHVASTVSCQVVPPSVGRCQSSRARLGLARVSFCWLVHQRDGGSDDHDDGIVRA
jgi:hypothetical protein